MNRSKIEDVLIEMGVPTRCRGFIYIADAIEIMDKIGQNIEITKDVYPEIAKNRKTTSSSVERTIRHAFGIARTRGNLEVVDKYIGFTNCTNFGSLVMLRINIARECEECVNEVPAEKEDAHKNEYITKSVIRGIVRDELRKFREEIGADLNYLKGVMQ